MTQTLPDTFIRHPFSFDIEAADPDGHSLSFQVTAPAWVQWQTSGATSITLTGTPPEGTPSTSSIEVTISDGIDSVTQSYVIETQPRALVELVNQTISVSEANGVATLTVRRSIQSAGEVQVDFTAVNGTSPLGAAFRATAGQDFTPTTGTLTWADGDMSEKTITIPLINDSIPEVEKTFLVQLSNLQGIADAGAFTAIMTLSDDDVPPGVEASLSDPYVIEHGTATHNNGAWTLNRSGDPANVFQGYVFNLDTVNLNSVGDFAEITFRIRSNTASNTARQVSWGFFEGSPVTGAGQRSITDNWVGYLHQIGTRTSGGTNGFAVARQGDGSLPLMDHVGGQTNFNGATATGSASLIHPSQDVLVSVRIERISDNQLRLLSTFQTPDSDRTNDGSSNGIQWFFNTENGVCRLNSMHSLSDGPTSFGGFAIASRGDGWVLRDLSMTSNASLPQNPTAPQILQQPQSVIVQVGEPAQFSVLASGNPSPTYQWYRNDEPLPGATSSSLEISAAQYADAGNYHVVVSNSEGSVISNTATLTVQTPPPQIVITRPGIVPAFIPADVGLMVEGNVIPSGLPGGPAPTVSWSVVSTPPSGSVTFAPADDINTAISFDVAGEYVLRLTADENGVQQTSDLTVHYGTGSASGGSGGPTDSLIGWWKMDENTGNSLNDASGNQPPGTLNGATWTEGRFGGGLGFNGTNQSVSLGNPTEVNGATHLSISLWAKVNDLEKDHTLLAKSSFNASNTSFLLWRDDDAYISKRKDTVAFLIGTGSSNVRIEGASNAMNTTDWHHIVITIEAGSPTGLRLYINGVEDPNSPVSLTSLTQIPSTVNDLLLGTTTDQASSKWLGGALDELRIYHRVLTPSEVTALSQEGPANSGPEVQVIDPESPTAGVSTTINALLQDDGLPNPPAAVQIQWQTVSGPGTAEFAQPNALQSPVTFPTAGDYVIRITADDSQIKTFRETAISVGGLANNPAEIWRLTYFGQTENTGMGADLTDPDGDGLPNLLKRASESDPTQGAYYRPQVGQIALAKKIYGTLQFRQITGGTESPGMSYTMNEMVYEAQLSETLAPGSWVGGPSRFIQVGTLVDHEDGTQTMTLRTVDPISAHPRLFLRIKVTQQP